MKYLSYLLILICALLMGCQSQETQGVDPAKDTEAVLVRNEDAYYGALGYNPLSPEYVAKEKAKMDKAMKALKIEDIEVGTGKEACDGDTVSVHYTGKLADGKVFDSSLKRKEPLDFVLGKGLVVKGWDLGVKGMKVGGKRKLTIPPELGYGEHGSGPIPPNSTLYFDVELVAVK